MKLFYIFFLISSHFCFAQNKLILTQGSDSLLLKYQKERTAFFGVSQIENINADFVFRFWNTNHLVQITSVKGLITGQVIYAVKSTDKSGRFFRKRFDLSIKDVEFVSELFNSKLNHLKVLNFESGFDGRSYIYETKKWNIYSINSYSTCCNDESEAKIYLEINKEIESEINFKDYYKIFEKEIPFRSYTYYGVPYTVLKL